MPKQFEVYTCAHCGIVIEVLRAGGGELVCCGEPMKHKIEGTSDGATEKHVPVIEKTAEGIKVTVGSVPHPMTPEHWIEWIEILADGRSYKKFLNPEDKPEATFCIQADNIVAREYCNLHGLWKNEG